MSNEERVGFNDTREALSLLARREVVFGGNEVFPAEVPQDPVLALGAVAQALNRWQQLLRGEDLETGEVSILRRLNEQLRLQYLIAQKDPNMYRAMHEAVCAIGNNLAGIHQEIPAQTGTYESPVTRSLAMIPETDAASIAAWEYLCMGIRENNPQSQGTITGKPGGLLSTSFQIDKGVIIEEREIESILPDRPNETTLSRQFTLVVWPSALNAISREETVEFSFPSPEEISQHVERTD